MNELQPSVESQCMLSASMFRGAISNLSLRKKLTILVTVGVFLPVMVLTYMQYQSLTELQNKTKGAFKDNLRQGLTLVERRMKQRLEDLATQTLGPLDSIDLSSLKATDAAAEEIRKAFCRRKAFASWDRRDFCFRLLGCQARS